MEEIVKKIIVVVCTLLVSIFYVAAEESVFEVLGPEKSYNQIRVINDTSVDSFNCRISVLKKQKDGSLKKDFVYGIFNLDGKGDTDSVTERIKKGRFLGIEFQKEYEGQFSYHVDYIDAPFFDIITIRILEKTDGAYSFEEKFE